MSSKNALTMMTLYRALQVMAAETKADASLQHLTTFTRIAAAGEPGIGMRALAVDMELSSATMTRIVDAISEWNRQLGLKVPGYNLVQRTSDEADARSKTLRLTPKGEKLAAKLAPILNKGHSG